MKQHPVFTRYYLDDNYNVVGPRKTLVPIEHHTGYLVYTVYTDDKKQTQVRAHRFIWECVLGYPIPDGMQINHIDGNKKNNSIDNLELCTAQENSIHRDSSGLRVVIFGSEHYNSKVEKDNIFNLFNDLENGMSNEDAGNKYNLHPRYISLIRHKRRRQKEWQEYERSETIREEYTSSEVEAAGT